MTPERVLPELPYDPAEALAGIEFWLLCEEHAPQMTAAEKVLVLKRKAELETKLKRRPG